MSTNICKLCINKCQDIKKECDKFSLISSADVVTYKSYNSLWSMFYECENCGMQLRYVLDNNRCPGCGKRILKREEYRILLQLEENENQ